LGVVVRTVERVAWDSEEIQRLEDLLHCVGVPTGGKSMRIALICRTHGHAVYRDEVVSGELKIELERALDILPL
jgi:hypothetical protein